jgi:hypothetical protein
MIGLRVETGVPAKLCKSIPQLLGVYIFIKHDLGIKNCSCVFCIFRSAQPLAPIAAVEAENKKRELRLAMDENKCNVEALLIT